MFLVDTEEGRIVADEEIKDEDRRRAALPRSGSTSTWSSSRTSRTPPELPEPDHKTVLQRQQAFGYTFEDLRMLMVPMARDGVEAVGSMGTDTPLAVLSDKPQAALQLFQAALRAGHQSADRLHPRGDRHLRRTRPSGPSATCSSPSRRAAT